MKMKVWVLLTEMQSLCLFQFFMFIREYGYNSYSSLNVVNTSRGPNRGVGGGECGCVYVIFLITASFGYLKTLKRTIRFHERTSKLLSNLQFEFKIFCWVGVKCRYHKNSFCWGGVGGKCFKFWPLPLIYAYIPCLTLEWVFHPKSKNRPTLVE